MIWFFSPDAESTALQRRLHQREDPPRQKRRIEREIRPQRRTLAINNNDSQTRIVTR